MLDTIAGGLVVVAVASMVAIAWKDPTTYKRLSSFIVAAAAALMFVWGILLLFMTKTQVEHMVAKDELRELPSVPDLLLLQYWYDRISIASYVTIALIVFAYALDYLPHIKSTGIDGSEALPGGAAGDEGKDESGDVPEV